MDVATLLAARGRAAAILFLRAMRRFPTRILMVQCAVVLCLTHSLRRHRETQLVIPLGRLSDMHLVSPNTPPPPYHARYSARKVLTLISATRRELIINSPVATRLRSDRDPPSTVDNVLRYIATTG